MTAIVFGLTGGLASGKSTVAARFRERGVPIIDADQLAREVVAPGSDGIAAVVREFGEGVLASNGALDRPKLAAIVFGDESKRKRLNAVLHPRISALTMERAAALIAKGETVVCYEAALVVENGVADAFRPLVVVAVPEAVQVERAMARDGATEAEARARIASQLPLKEKIEVADFVIDNGGTREATLRRADEVLDAIRSRSSA